MNLRASLAIACTGMLSVVAGPALAGGTAPDAVAPNPFAGSQDWVAYQTFRDGREGVYLVHPDGSGDHEVDFGLDEGYALLPDWSPDGNRLAATTRDRFPETLVEHDLATGSSRELFSCEWPCAGDDEPAYSPDGRHVAFIRYFGPFDDDGPADCSLWVGEVATGTVHRVSDNERCDREYFPRWSPDSSRLTYHRERPAANGWWTSAVFTVRADGTDERRLSDFDLVGGTPDWSPDGDWIVFSTHPLGTSPDRDSELFRVRPDGTGLQQLTAFRSVRAVQPRYTPDGRWIVFTADRPRQRSLWALPAAGGTPVVLAHQERIYTHGTWQPGS